LNAINQIENEMVQPSMDHFVFRNCQRNSLFLDSLFFLIIWLVILCNMNCSSLLF